MKRILTIGDLRKVIENLDDDFTIEMRVRTRVPDEELAKLSETAQHYGETTQFSASEAADALGYMALAGWDADKATKELGGVLKLAAASGMELAESSDMVTDYLSAFSNSEMTAAQFADKLAYAQANSNTTAEQLGQAYKNSAANLNAAGQDVETVTSLLAAMANQGLKGSEAGTALTAMMRDLTKNMGRAQVVSKAFVDGISNDLVYNFEELGGATKEFNSEMRKYLQSEYGLTIEQTELLACTQILELAESFYQNPQNQQAFEAWKQRKEAKA